MPVKTATSGSKSRQIRIAPIFEGMRVTVPAGAFNWKGERCSLVDTFEADLLSDAEVTTDVTGYIAREESSGEFIVLLDEVKRNGVDVPFDFQRSEDYTLVAKLFRVMVTAAAVSLDDLNCVIFESIDRPASPPSQGRGSGPVEKAQRLLDRFAAKAAEAAKEKQPDPNPEEVPDE